MGKSTSFGVYSPCYGRGYGYPCGDIDYSNDCNGFFGKYGSSSSSPCDTRFGIYSYGSCDDSDDYCGGYGYLDCGSNVDGTPCGRSDFDFGCGTYVYADCEGQDQASSSFGVYSPCYGRGYGYPCGGVEIRDNCNGFFGKYGNRLDQGDVIPNVAMDERDRVHRDILIASK